MGEGDATGVDAEVCDPKVPTICGDLSKICVSDCVDGDVDWAGKGDQGSLLAVVDVESPGIPYSNNHKPCIKPFLEDDEVDWAVLGSVKVDAPVSFDECRPRHMWERPFMDCFAHWRAKRELKPCLSDASTADSMTSVADEPPAGGEIGEGKYPDNDGPTTLRGEPTEEEVAVHVPGGADPALVMKIFEAMHFEPPLPEDREYVWQSAAAVEAAARDIAVKLLKLKRDEG